MTPAARIALLEAELVEAREILRTELAAERAAHARTRSDLDAARAEAAAKHNALVHAYEVLRCPTVTPSGHSGDEDSGNCEEDCAKCAVEGALAHADEALDGTAGRAIAERVPLWRELSKRVRTGNTICGHGYSVRPVADCDACEIEQILRKLAALDEKGGG